MSTYRITDSAATARTSGGPHTCQSKPAEQCARCLYLTTAPPPR